MKKMESNNGWKTKWDIYHKLKTLSSYDLIVYITLCIKKAKWHYIKCIKYEKSTLLLKKKTHQIWMQKTICPPSVKVRHNKLYLPNIRWSKWINNFIGGFKEIYCIRLDYSPCFSIRWLCPVYDHCSTTGWFNCWCWHQNRNCLPCSRANPRTSCFSIVIFCQYLKEI